MSSIEAAGKVIAASAISGAPLHIVHIQSTGMHATGDTLDMIQGARDRGLDVTTECYPYSAGMTAIDSALFSEGWQDKYGIGYDSLQWADTGERLTSSTFAEYRETGGMVIVHSTPQDAVDTAVTSPLTAIATDGFLRGGKGHPRTAGTYSLILGRYVRERGALSPVGGAVEMLAHAGPAAGTPRSHVRRQGPSAAGSRRGHCRVQPGGRSSTMPHTRSRRSRRPEIEYVVVGGTAVVRSAQIVSGVSPGQGVRAPV